MDKYIIGFSPKTIEMLKYYVYVYSNPDTRKPFYVGKGKGNRAFAHMFVDGDSDKINEIKEIRSKGKEPLVEILVHGIDEDVALKVEAAAIDLIGIENLTNSQRGHQSSTYGKIEANKLEARYSHGKLSLEDITDNVILIRINRYYRNNMNPFELYDLTRGCWRVKLEQAQKAEYAFAVFDGMVLKVYSISQWLNAGDSMSYLRDEDLEKVKHRFEFVGNIAPEKIRNKYVNKSVASLFNHGNQNPIKYILNNESNGE